MALAGRILILILAVALISGCQTATLPQKTVISTPSEELRDQELRQEIEARLLTATHSPESLTLLQRSIPARPPAGEIEAQVARELAELEQKAKLPITLNDDVRRWIDIFQTRYHKKFSLWMSRSGRYIPMMKEILSKYGLPEDLVYLAMIESGFSCQARSRAQAVGPWQFIRSTGRRYGLKIDGWVDERRDPVKASHAASRYLLDLYQEFGTWYLACAGYNAGEGKIRKALKYHNADNFWDIANPTTRRRSYIKRETRNYVPKMIAAAIIAKDPARYGFAGQAYEEPLAYETTRITIPVDLKLVAREMGVSYTTLRDLNPELHYPTTPQNGKPYELRLPVGGARYFTTNIARFKAKPIQTFVAHKLRPGENPGSVARKYGISVKRLMDYNRISNPRRLRAGRVLKIPVRSYGGDSPATEHQVRTVRRSEPKASTRAATAAPVSAARASAGVSHRVRSGENLWSISRKYHVDLKKLMAYNNIGRHRKLKIGQVLDIPPSSAKAAAGKVHAAPSNSAGTKATGAKPRSSRASGTTPVVHVVKSGENIWGISRKYNISHKKLMVWNNIKNHRQLQIGQRLVVYLDQS